MSTVVHALYTRRLRARVAAGPVPRHLAVVMDGNRRWARRNGLANARLGHQHGAGHVEEFLGWCAEVGIDHVSVFAASRDNLVKRDPDEMAFLMRVCEQVVAERLARPSGRWRVHVAGQLDLLPDSTAQALTRAEHATRDRDLHLTVAIGYGGRQEIVDAVRSLLLAEAAAGTTAERLAGTLRPEDIAAHLYTRGQPEPDMVIRTSGEQRLSDFLPWQTVGSQLYFCDVYWPGFRRVDFLRALRAYAVRHRPAHRRPDVEVAGSGSSR